MGNETSFQSFPAHLHNLLSVTLRDGDDEDGYVVHTKVYPKFKTRHAINVATLEFSKWCVFARLNPAPPLEKWCPGFANEKG
jgi:hypothetical protein